MSVAPILFRQAYAVTDIFRAKVAAVCGIVVSLAESVARDRKELFKGPLSLQALAIARNERNDGLQGVCWEYAVHRAARENIRPVCGVLHEALSLLGAAGTEADPISSEIWGIEKARALHEDVSARLGPNARLWTPGRGAPVKAQANLTLARSPGGRAALPKTASGLMRTDLLIRRGSGNWYAVSVKSDQGDLRAAPGVTIGVYPARSGEASRVTWDDDLCAALCPIPYDAGFTQAFNEAFNLVDLVLEHDAQKPPERRLPRPDDMFIAEELARLRGIPIPDLVQAMADHASQDLVQLLRVELAASGSAQTAVLVLPDPLIIL